MDGNLPGIFLVHYRNADVLLLESVRIVLIKDIKGNELLDILNPDEDKADAEYQPITHCLAVVKVGGDYLLGWNKYRQEWEIFGGCREKGESSRDCILRECNEEFGFASTDITYIGAMKYLLKPDYFSKEEREELGGLYGISLPDTSLEDIYCCIKDKDEITEMRFYSQVKDKEPIALIDEKLLEYYT